MEFVCYHRDRPGSMPLREALLEEHWSYMDQFAEEMIARGPTYSGDILTGSVHILDLPDPASARAFAFAEPGYQAGAYRDVLLRRWQNRLGRTMWDYRVKSADAPTYLVLGLGPTASGAEDEAPDEDRLIAYGPLLSDDGIHRLGTLALVEASSAESAREVLSANEYADVEVHRWHFGGRPS